MFKRANAWLDRQNIIVQIAVLLGIVYLIKTFLFGLYLVPTGSMETRMLIGERFFADKLTPYFRPLKRGDIITFNSPKFAYSDNVLKRIWQKYIWGPENWTKRVIGLPGEHVRGAVENGKPEIYVNGKRLDEPYLNSYPLIGLWERQKNGQMGMTTRSFDPKLPFDKQPFYAINTSDIIRGADGLPLVLWPRTPQSFDTFDRQLGSNEYWVMGDNRMNSGDSREWGPLKHELLHGRVLFRLTSIDTQEGWLLWDIIKHPISFWSKVRPGRNFSSVS